MNSELQFFMFKNYNFLDYIMFLNCIINNIINTAEADGFLLLRLKLIGTKTN